MLNYQEVVDRVNQGFRCRTSRASPPPHKVSPRIYGNHTSYVDGGFRFWGFENEEGRDAFVLDYDAEVIS